MVNLYKAVQVYSEKGLVYIFKYMINIWERLRVKCEMLSDPNYNKAAQMKNEKKYWKISSKQRIISLI